MSKQPTMNADQAVLEDLRLEIEAEPSGSRAPLRRALSLLSEGDPAGAQAALRLALRRRSCSPAAAALMGSVADLLGQPARSWLDRAVEAGGAKAWPRVLRALTLRRQGRLREALADASAAAVAEPRRWWIALRADLLSDLGHVVEAIAELDRLAALEGADAPLLARRAQFHLQRRDYARARADLDGALAAAPKDAALWTARADLHGMQGDLRRAQADLESALALSPKDEPLRLARLRLLVQRGRARAASREIALLRRSADPQTAGEALFSRGCLAFKKGAPGRGQADFKAIMRRRPVDDPLSMRARFYWAASRAVDPVFRRRTDMNPALSASTQLYLCGLGIFPPYTASLEVLHALSRCDVIFNNVAGPEVRSLLAQFCGDIRPASYQAWQDEPKWADAIFSVLAKGKRVAFVTRGHPLVFGGLAVELLRRSRGAGIECKTFAAVSSIDYLLAALGLGLGDNIQGVQVFDRPAIEAARTINTAQPLLSCFYSGLEASKQVAAFRRSLERFYAPEHECLMFGPKYDDAPVKLPLAALEKRYPEIHASLMLLLPAVKEAGRRS